MTDVRRAGVYFGLLAVVGGFADPNGGLVQVPLLYLLRDGLGRGPEWVAWFGAAIAVPGHLGFLFGALRDRWRPARFGDRAHFLFVAVAAACGYVWLASAPASLMRLAAGALVIAVAFQMFDASASALLTTVAQRHLASGRLSAVVEMADSLVSVAAMLAGGWLAGHASAQTTFAVAAAVAALIAVFGVWAPREVFPPETAPTRAPREPLGLTPLLRTRGFAAVLAILLLYSFSPGWGTPFFFYLTAKLSISSEAFGACRAITFAAMAAATALYGVLCTRLPLRTLLWSAMLVNVLPGFLFLFVTSVPFALATAALGGLCSGFGTIALLDLLTRACPPALEGTASMLGVSALGLAWTIGDLLGARLYQQGGFTLCIVIDAVATVAIMPLLLKLPSTLIAYADGVRSDGPHVEGCE